MVCEEFYFLVKNSGEFVHIGENKRKFRHNLHIFSVEKNVSRLWVTRGSESIRRLKRLTQKCSPRVARPFLDGEESESKPAAGSDGHPCHSQSNGSGQVGTHLAFHQQRIRGPLVPKICGEDMHDSLTFVPNNFLLYFRWGKWSH